MKSNYRELLVLGFVVLAILVRLTPHPPNFTPVTALAIFGASTFKNKYLGLSLPLIAMIISDIFLGFSSITLWVYGAFLSISILSTYWKKVRVHNVLLSSFIFFLVTNFGVWLLGYPKTFEGFILCYTLALPFFLNSIMGDIFYTYILKYSFKFSETKITNYVKARII